MYLPSKFSAFIDSCSLGERVFLMLRFGADNICLSNLFAPCTCHKLLVQGSHCLLYRDLCLHLLSL